MKEEIARITREKISIFVSYMSLSYCSLSHIPLSFSHNEIMKTKATSHILHLKRPLSGTNKSSAICHIMITYTIKLSDSNYLSLI